MQTVFPDVSERSKVLLLSSGDAGTVLLQEIIAKHADAATASDIDGMLNLLAEESYDIFFCDWRFAMGTWRDALEEIQRQDPEMPVIVVCRTGGQQEWREVLEAGASDLLTAPYCERVVLSVLERALAHGRGSRRTLEGAPQSVC